MRTKPSDLLQPLARTHQQVYYGRGLHTLGLIRWVLEQTGRADILITTFSTSDEFLSGFQRLRKEGLVGHATLLLDLKATKKTAQLKPLMAAAFDDVYLGENHAKCIVFSNAGHDIFVNSSLNQTYGGRNECTTITDNAQIAHKARNGILAYCCKSMPYAVRQTTD